MQTNHSSSEILVTRRGFLYGALGAVAAIGTGAALASAADMSPMHPKAALAATGDGNALEVSSDRVLTTDDCEYIENIDDAFEVAMQSHLPYGTMVWADDDEIAACLLPCETSSPLTQVGLLSLTSGELRTVLENAVGQKDGFEIYDVRANSKGAVWTEADILNGEWRIYTARMEGPGLSAPKVAAESQPGWETPSIAVSGDCAFWQMLPEKDGPASKESSLLMRIPFGAGAEDARSVYESDGRMACPPSSSSSGIAIAPRANDDGIRYELVHIDASSGQVTDELTLPASMKPTFVAYGATGFSFAFEDIYNYGDGISNLGTYTPANGDIDGEWFHFARTPFTPPAWSGPWFFVKSTSVVAAIDLTGRRYATIQPENATQGYGEFLASSGTAGRLVTYSNIDYTPLNGERIEECNVRVWKAR